MSITLTLIFQGYKKDIVDYMNTTAETKDIILSMLRSEEYYTIIDCLPITRLYKNSSSVNPLDQIIRQEITLTIPKDILIRQLAITASTELTTFWSEKRTEILQALNPSRHKKI